MNPHLLEVFMGGGPRIYLEDRDVTNIRIDAICDAGIRIQGSTQRYIVATGGNVTYHTWYPFGTVPSATYWLKATWANVSNVSIGPIPDPDDWTELKFTTAKNFYIRRDSPVGTATADLTLQLATDSSGSNIISTSVHALSAEYQTS